MWAVDATEEYLRWFAAQPAEVREVVLAKVLLLQEFGPQLGRPHADTLKGSRIKNLKELSRGGSADRAPTSLMEADMAIVKNAVKAMKSMMSADQVRRARLAADREILSLHLAKLRERQGVRQSDIKAFSQTAISKLERRKDMKLSTLIEYLEGIGMGLEIRVYRKGVKGAGRKETLLRV